MLTLSRRQGERIHVGDNIVIVVKELMLNQVRISIEAPRDIKIYRGEIYDKIDKRKVQGKDRSST